MLNYGNNAWGDLLTAYDGVAISYDTIGNPLYDGTWHYNWQNGRELASMSNGSVGWGYTYDANGMRTKRTGGGVTYTYVYNGGQLSQMTVGNNTLSFVYDATGAPVMVFWRGVPYYYITNLQGDVIAILDADGNIVVSYDYDAWGRLLYVSGSKASTLGAMNPLTYRGYVYDRETGLYYLQSRYYNPTIGRFLNADALVSTGQGLLGNNMFAYCLNNPVVNVDTEGTAPYLTLADYYAIHRQVQYEIAERYGYAIEVYVYGFGRRGYLDLYDPVSNTFYEVKSVGAAITAEIQMFRYENSVVKDARFMGYHISESPSRGNEKFTGTFSYEDYLIKYITNNGLIVYSAIPKPKRSSSPQTNAISELLIGGAVLACAIAFGNADRNHNQQTI